jgi:hypothetical protein
MRVVLGCLSVMCSLATAETAHGKCRGAATTIEPASGRVPPEPTLYVFDRSLPLITATLDGKPIEIEWKVLSGVEAFTAYQARIPGARAGTLVLRRHDHPDVALQIDPGWTGPADESNTILGFRDSVDRWSCSHEDARFLSPSVEAPAYRVRWSTGADDWKRGRVREVVVPRSTVDLHAQWGSVVAKGPPRIGLGYLNCLGAVTDVPHPVMVSVSALLPDGREIPGRPMIFLDVLQMESRERLFARLGMGGFTPLRVLEAFWALAAILIAIKIHREHRLPWQVRGLDG